jgi:ferrous iron transport protein B
VIATKTLTIALAGNPNSGKTTIFNNLTRARQHVGNYPGVTVEKKEGRCEHDGTEFNVVDLPGAYSLTAFSPEELVARQYLIETSPDVVVDILDASNLERNLYLAMQFLELGVPLVLVCNMADMVSARGDRLDVERLSRELGVPVIATVGHRRQGMEALLEACMEAAEQAKQPPFPRYAPEVDSAVAAIAKHCGKRASAGQKRPSWIAIKLLENDAAVQEEWQGTPAELEARAQADALLQSQGEPPETAIAAARYNYIANVVEATYTAAGAPSRNLSDRIDAIVTNRLLAIPIFLAAMFAVFWATFNLSAAPSEWIESGIAWLGATVSGWWPAGSSSPLRSLLVNGIITGVGNVIVFLPNILILFFAIGLLEDSGYMPRAAFIMDRVMNRIGLHGKTFIPLLLGFGCTVPAIMATRTLESRRDRLTAMLVAPLNELRCTPSHLCTADSGLLPAAVAGVCAVDRLYHWHRSRDFDFEATAQHDVQGCADAVRYGVASVSCSFVPRLPAPHVGAFGTVPEEGRNGDSGNLDPALGADEFSRAAGAAWQHRPGGNPCADE